MLWWNEVSKAAKLNASGKTFLKALIPIKLAGLCNGAKSAISSICSMTLSSITAEVLKYSPPATTRWPTAVISFKSFTIPNSSNNANNLSTAILWSLTSSWLVNFSPAPYLMVIAEPSIPIRSIKPLAKTSSSGIANNLNFKLELPELITIVFSI